MKNIFIIITIALGLSAINAQVGIDGAEVRPGALLDFPTNQSDKGGILLPRLTNTADVSSEPGALAYNITTQRVEYYDTDVWKPLSVGQTQDVDIAHNTNDFPETDSKGVTIADGPVLGTQEGPNGVLILNSNSKALVLPNVADATLLPSPQAGTIVYDMNSQSLAVYNGEVWSFWN